MHRLKIATQEDLEAILVLLEEFFNKTVYSTITDYSLIDTRESIANLLKVPVSQGCFVLLVSETGQVDGLLIGSYMNHMFNKAEKTAVEIALYIREGVATRALYKKLLQAYRYWAKSIGCNSIMTGQLAPSPTEVESYSIRKLR